MVERVRMLVEGTDVVVFEEMMMGGGGECVRTVV